MYDFLLQEDWWMETIGAALITAGATFLVAYLAYADKINKIMRELERMKELLDAQNSVMKDENQKRTSEHNGLSVGHKELSAENKELSKEHQSLKDAIHKVIVYQASEKTARETASKTLPNESGLVNMAKAVLDNNMFLQQENAKLNAQMQFLQQENQQLKIQIRNFENIREQSVELEEMDLFSASFDDPEL